MADALLADLRALAEKWDARYGPFPNGFCHSLTIHEATGSIRQLIAKHAPEPDVSERDELARVIGHDDWCRPDDDCGCFCGLRNALRTADAILVAGWRRR